MMEKQNRKIFSGTKINENRSDTATLMMQFANVYCKDYCCFSMILNY